MTCFANKCKKIFDENQDYEITINDSMHCSFCNNTNSKHTEHNAIDINTRDVNPSANTTTKCVQNLETKNYNTGILPYPYSSNFYRTNTAPYPAYPTRISYSLYLCNWKKMKKIRFDSNLINSHFIAFDEVYHQSNTKNVYGIDDENILYSIFSAIIENNALKAYNTNTDIITCLLKINEGTNGFFVNGNVNQSDQLSWTINYKKTTQGRWVELVQQIFNFAPQDALSSLAKMLNMSFENMYQLFREEHAAEKTGREPQYIDIPKQLWLANLPSQYRSATLVRQIPILGNAGQTIGALVEYQIAEQTFYLPATVGNGVLCIGKYKPTAHFLNQHLMAKYPLATILLCQDMRSAVALQERLQQVIGYQQEQYIITAHLGEDLSVLPWNYFYGHNVILVPAPSVHCLGMIADYTKKIGEKTGVTHSFRIYPGFLLHTACVEDKQTTVNTGSIEDILNTAGVIIPHEKQPIQLLQHITDNAMPYNDFVQWGQDIGFYKGNSKQRKHVEITIANTLPQLEPALLPEKACELSAVTLYHMLRPGSIAMILGAKGSGKTQTALSACNAILQGDCMWPLFSGGVSHDENIAYVDAETPFDEYQGNLQQHDLAGKAGVRFFGLSRFASDLPDFCASFSLNDQTFRDGLTAYLLEHKCRFLFLDNLTALMGDAVQQASAATVVLDWVKILQQHQICIVLVHHKTETDTTNPGQEKARGSQHFEILARSIVSLFSKADILAGRVKSNERVQKSAKQAGLTVGLHFRVSKAAPILDGKTVWLYLPLGSGKWEYLAATDASDDEIPTSSLPRNEGSMNEHELRQSSQVNMLDLTPDERKVVEHITSKGSVKREDVEGVLSCKEDKAGKILKALCDAEIIVKDGASRNTYYKLADKV